MMMKGMLTAAWIGVLSLGLSATAMALTGRCLGLDIIPSPVRIGTFFHGQNVVIHSEIKAGQDMVVEVKGPEDKEPFGLKGKVGPFWMNQGKVRFSRVPSLYLLLLPGGENWEKRLAPLGLGIASLRREVVVDAPGQDPQRMSDMFVHFKEAHHLYREVEGSITYSPVVGGIKKVTAVFNLPPSISTGQYQVEASLLKGERLVDRVSGSLMIEDGPALRAVKEWAYHDGLMFGVIAVLIALAAGAAMGTLFKGGGKGH
jgi:hypothetical protein